MCKSVLKRKFQSFLSPILWHVNPDRSSRGRGASRNTDQNEADVVFPGRC